MRPRRASARRGEGAASLVEFAIAAPLFLVLLFLILDFGKAIYVQNTIDSAAREGARAAVVLLSAGGAGEPKSSDVERAVKNHSSDVSLANPSPYCTAAAPSSGNTGDIYIGPSGTEPGGDQAASGPCPSGSYNVTPDSGNKPITVTI